MRDYLCKLNIVVIELLLHNLLENAQCENMGFLQCHLLLKKVEGKNVKIRRESACK